MNPLKYLSPALYTRLASPALTVAGVNVPVFEHLSGPEAGHYVLLQQPTHSKLPGAAGCKGWSCTALIDIITQFQPGYVSSEPGDELLDQITDRLEDQRLVIPGFDCGPATFEPSLQTLDETDGELAAVRRLIRFRWDVYYHGGPVGGTALRAVAGQRLRAIHT
jgi:hypothetical protein